MNLYKSFNSALDNICARPPAPPAAWNHQICTAGEVSGSTTMVVMIVVCLCCCGWTCDVTSSTYVKKRYKNNLKMRLMMSQSGPPRR
jgi:hypothetical protein